MAKARVDRPSRGTARIHQAKPLLEHLPSASEISEAEQLAIMFGRISHDLELLAAEEVRARITGYTTWTTESFDQELDDAFVELHIELAARDAQLDTALSLGHILPDTTYLPQKENTAQITYSFDPARLQNAHEWLSDLQRVLPEGAAEAVDGSLRNWKHYVRSGRAATDPDFILNLHRQGKLWKQLICGDKAVSDQLSAEDYSNAAARLAGKLALTTGNYLKQWWKIILFLALLVLGGGVAAVIFLPSDQKLVAVLAALVGTVGISWKTIGASLGRIFSTLEKPLWEAEKKEAVVQACTLHVPHQSPRSAPNPKVIPTPSQSNMRHS